MPRCETCGQIVQKDSLASHMAKHRAVESNPNAVQCRLCGKYLSCERFLQKHLEGHAEPFKCPFCNRHCGKKERLEEHKQTCHTRRYNCDECVLSFNNVRGLYDHRVADHPGSPKLRCSYCRKVFNLSGLYAKHVFKCRRSQ